MNIGVCGFFKLYLMLNYFIVLVVVGAKEEHEVELAMEADRKSVV